MPAIGVRNLHYAPITNEDPVTGYETYGDPVRLARTITINLSVELADAILYADDGAVVVIKEFKTGSLAINVDDLGHQVSAAIIGASIDDNGVLVNADIDTPNPVAIGFEAPDAYKRLRKFWLPRATFGVPSMELETMGDSITFKTPTINGTVMKRNKLDARGARPWKFEAREGDIAVPQSVLDNWFNEVYDPDNVVVPPTEPPIEPPVEPTEP